jgi:hypothetical protein
MSSQEDPVRHEGAANETWAQNGVVLRRSLREPFPLCGDHPATFGVAQMLGRCQQCGGETNAAYVMCGWCAEERGVCVLDGNAALGLDGE